MAIQIKDKIFADIQGNADSATKLSTIGLLPESMDRGTIAYSRFDNPENVAGLPTADNANGVLTINTHEGHYNHQLGFSTSGFFYRKVYDKGSNASGDWREVAFTDSNVVSATKATQDGSGNIITSTYVTKTEFNNGLNTKSNTGHTHDDRYYTESEMNTKLAAKSDTGHTHTEYLPSSKAITHDTGTTRYLMGVSTTATTTLGSASIYTSSKVYSNGSNLYATSDETLKDFISDIDCDLEALSKLPKKYFTWKGDESKTVEIGTSAQKVKELYPEMVTVDPNEKLGVAYDKLSVVALAAIDKLYAMYKESQEEIKELKSRIEELEK